MRDAKVNDWYDAHIEDYDEARNYEFYEQLNEFYNELIAEKKIVTEDDVQGFLDSFTFPEEGEWLANEYESFLDDLEDQKYLAYKERDI